MEYAIGEKFKVNGCVYVVVKDESDYWKDCCGRCVLYGKCRPSLFHVFGECDGVLRSDGESVHFEHFGVDFDPTRHQHAF